MLQRSMWYWKERHRFNVRTCSLKFGPDFPQTYIHWHRCAPPTPFLQRFYVPVFEDYLFLRARPHEQRQSRSFPERTKKIGVLRWNLKHCTSARITKLAPHQHSSAFTWNYNRTTHHVHHQFRRLYRASGQEKRFHPCSPRLRVQKQY